MFHVTQTHKGTPVVLASKRVTTHHAHSCNASKCALSTLCRAVSCCVLSVSPADMLKAEKTGGKKFMDFGGEILPYAAANNIKVNTFSVCFCVALCLGIFPELPCS